jgi:hypothetical protein
MQTLTCPGVLDQTLARIASLHPGDAARWGRMNGSQMLCHLCDSAKVATGEIVLPLTNPGPSAGIFKWLALEVPIRWKKNFPTMPQIDQFKHGTPPTEFECDRESLLKLTTHLAQSSLEGNRHPYFGPMTQREWMRWAWLHTDHHLRQFGR